MLNKSLIVIAVSAALSSAAVADSPKHGPMAFDPITGSAYGLETDPSIPTAPWLIPEGFSQRIVSDETDLNIYTGNDWNDMNTVNETKKHAGRYLYRTHEVRLGNDTRIDGGMGGAVSVVDLKTGVAKEIAARADWEALDGIVWTPWHTVLFAEETGTSARPDPDVPQATSGLLYEIKLMKNDPTTAASVTVRPLLGALAHEGIESDSEGNVYVIDEDRKGAIYKFVPENYGDLSSGQLYALRVTDPSKKTGAAEWVALDMTQAQISARVTARANAAAEFCRPEDIERIGNTLYVAATCEDVNNPANTSGPGAVLAVHLGNTPSVKYVVAPGKNVPFETQPTAALPGITGFKSPDNLADGPDGKLWIVEDNDFSDIWVYDPASEDANADGYRDGVALFASLKDKPAEGTGIYFGKSPRMLFVNVQHSGTGNDKTMAITKNRGHDDDDEQEHDD